MRRFNFNKPMVESPYPPQDINVLWVDRNESTGKVASIKKFLRGEWVDYLTFVPEPEPVAPVVGPADNEIWYYTTDNSVAKVWGDTNLDHGDPNWCQNIYIGNVYTDKGILTFQEPLTILEGDEDGVGGQIFYYDDGSRGISYAEKVHTIILPKTLLGIHDALTNIPLQNIIFMGTKEQWNNIDKSSRFMGNIPWNEGIPATYVQCSDGQVAL